MLSFSFRVCKHPAHTMTRNVCSGLGSGSGSVPTQPDLNLGGFASPVRSLQVEARH